MSLRSLLHDIWYWRHYHYAIKWNLFSNAGEVWCRCGGTTTFDNGIVTQSNCPDGKTWNRSRGKANP